MSFPSSLPSYAGLNAGQTLQADNHTAQTNAQQADTVALATKLGTGASTPTSTSALVGNGTGTSTWGQVALTSMVSGVLSTSNGGTGTTSTTGTGSVVYGTAPTISNPTESGGTYNSATIPNPTITYNNNSIPAAAIINNSLTTSQLATSLALPPITSNPCKFSAYRNSAANTGNTVYALVTFDTTDYNTGNNYSTSTGLFTAPSTGFYRFSGYIECTAGTFLIVAWYKNGSIWKKFLNINSAGGGASTIEESLSAGDTISIEAQGSTSAALLVGTSPRGCTFSGSLVSAT